MYREYRDRANFLLVYIREAHPSDSNWADESVDLEDPKTLHERMMAANQCGEDLKFTIPTVVDDLEDSVSLRYSAWPERFYLLEQGGIIRYRGGLGPWGFKPEEAGKALISLLG